MVTTSSVDNMELFVVIAHVVSGGKKNSHIGECWTVGSHRSYWSQCSHCFTPDSLDDSSKSCSVAIIEFKTIAINHCYIYTRAPQCNSGMTPFLSFLSWAHIMQPKYEICLVQLWSKSYLVPFLKYRWHVSFTLQENKHRSVQTSNSMLLLVHSSICI
jgi:hypothetical protein